MKREHMTRQAEIRDLQKQLQQLKVDRELLEAQRTTPGTTFEEFLQLSNRICSISVKQYTCKRKMYNLESGLQILGHPLPNHSTTEMSMQERGGKKNG